MAESGCLMSSKMHALTINHNVKTNHFESKTTLDLSEGITVDENIEEADGNLIFKTKSVGDSVYPDPDGDKLTFTPTATNLGNSVLRKEIHDSEAIASIGGVEFPTVFQGVESGLNRQDGFGQRHTDDATLRNIINPVGGGTPYTISQPANSILKNMYILVRNNNFSVSQFFGNESSGSGLRNYDLSETEVPNTYDNIGLRLNVSIGEESSNITENNFFEERTDGGGHIVIVPGNHNDTSSTDGGASDVAGVTATTNPTKAMPPNRRPAVDSKRQMFRHNGVLLGKDTLIPVITNYTFSSAQEKLNCINQNGYSSHYENITMDNIKITDNTTAPLYNSSSTARKIHVVIDASPSTLTGTGFNATAGKTGDGQLTGADFTYLPNALTQPRDVDADKTYDNTGDKAYYMQVRHNYNANPQHIDFSMTPNDVIGNNPAAIASTKTGYASNLLRDNVYCHPDLKDTYNGVCTGLPEEAENSDYRHNETPEYGLSVEFKVICDFQHLN